MNSDIRLSVDFFSHHKTKKVLRKIGPEGVICLVRLFCYVGKFRPEGRLEGMDVEGISDAVDWSGDAEELVSTLCGAGFIEQSDDGVYIIHDWKKHNPWAAGANERSLAASKAGKASAEKRAKTAKNPTDVQREGNGRSTESNEASTPSPSPSPSPKEYTTPLTPHDGGEEKSGKEQNPESSCPHQKIIEAYHEILPECPRIRVWPKASERQMAARWRESKERQSLEWWRHVFSDVSQSDFLMGRTARDGPFVFSLGWFVKPTNFAKVLNGQYKNRKQKSSGIRVGGLTF